jgi:hypothetical protein
VLLAAAAVVALGACDPWHCQFDSHGACVEFASPPADVGDAQRRIDALLDRELPFWGLSSLKGWRIQFRDTTDYPCYLADKNDGCTDYVQHTLSVHVSPDSGGCFEAAELLHELGHYALGDPMHSNGQWEHVDGAFAEMVWRRPDAAPDCVERFSGVTTGMWPVRVNQF